MLDRLNSSSDTTVIIFNHVHYLKRMFSLRLIFKYETKRTE